jgi:hypothetical protein
MKKTKVEFYLGESVMKWCMSEKMKYYSKKGPDKVIGMETLVF